MEKGLQGFGSIIGRVYSTHPGEEERSYMRMLLNHVTGCTSFEDIRTLSNGTNCSTFKEAARKRVLLEDDNEYDLCLADPANCSIPPQLRQLFVTILIFNSPSALLVLWEKYKGYFCEDFYISAHKSLPNLDCVCQKMS